MTTDRATITDAQREWLEGLRAMADWFEQHPPYLDCDPVRVLRVVSEWKDGYVPVAMAQAARALGKADKSSEGAYFNLTGRFGPHEVQIFTEREQICERVVVGTEEVTVTEPDPEAVAALPTVTRTETREVVEWRCPDSLLAAARDDHATIQDLVTEPSAG